MQSIFPAALAGAAPKVYTVHAEQQRYSRGEDTQKVGRLDGWTIRGPLILAPGPWYAGQSGEAIARAVADALNAAAYVADWAVRYGGLNQLKDWLGNLPPPAPAVPENCRNAAANAGRSYPRTCPQCGFAGQCKAGLPFEPPGTKGPTLSYDNSLPERGTVVGPEEFPGTDEGSHYMSRGISAGASGLSAEPGFPHTDPLPSGGIKGETR